MVYDLGWFKGKRITVMGLGLHGGGLGVAKWLLRRGARLTVTDMKDRKSLAKSIAILDTEYKRCLLKPPFKTRPKKIRYVLGKHDKADFIQADMIIRNPAVPQDHHLLIQAEKKGIPVESDTSLFFLLCPYPITAVTGTKGKTTTTTLLSEICQKYDKRTVVGGNIRISSMDGLDSLLRLSARKQPAPPIVLELSSWQLESLEKHKLSPSVSVITNIMRDHLNRYGGRMTNYAAAKELIVKFQKQNDTAVVNADDKRVEAMTHRLEKRSDHPRIIRFSMVDVRHSDACFLEKGNVVVIEKGRKYIVVPLKSIKIIGEHNIANILAAVAVARSLHIPLKIIAAAVRAFKGVSGRLEMVATKKCITYINDTTATTPDASKAAVETFTDFRTGERGAILIAGGADKDLHFGSWAKIVAQSVKGLILFNGTATPKMEQALRRAKTKVSWVKVKSMKDAMKAAQAIADSGDTVLLSPGCASFGIFVNEFDRGDQFVAEVKKIK